MKEKKVLRREEGMTIKILKWEEVRERIQRLNPEFVSIVDPLNPGVDYPLFQVSYLYGSEILKKGYLQLPNAQGKLASLKDHYQDPRIKESLSYNHSSSPVSMVLNCSAEVFLTLENHTIPSPYGLILPGRLFGDWRILDREESHYPTFLWNMTAGARSLFMLPKISEASAHNRVKKEFNLHVDKPTSLLDQWSVFKAIAQKSSHHPWTMEVLFFGKEWFQQLNDLAWMGFHRYLLNSAWETCSYWRNQIMWDLVFSLIQKRRNIKRNYYYADTVKHLFAMGVGAALGFSPALDDTVAPIKLIQQVYLDVYNIHYAPIIMQPYSFSQTQHRPVYYSLRYPTAIEFSQKPRSDSSAIADLSEVRYILKKYVMEILSGDLNIESTPLYKAAQQLEYNFFHSDAEDYHDILPSIQIPEVDETFHQTTVLCKEHPFPSNGTFVRGCIQILPAKN